MGILFSRKVAASAPTPPATQSTITQSVTKATTAEPKNAPVLPLMAKTVVPVPPKTEVLKTFAAIKQISPPPAPIAVKKPINKPVESESASASIPSAETTMELGVDTFVRLKESCRIGEENLLGRISFMPKTSKFVRVQWEVGGSFGTFPDVLEDARHISVLEIVPTPKRYQPFAPKKKVVAAETNVQNKPIVKAKIKLEKNKNIKNK